MTRILLRLSVRYGEGGTAVNRLKKPGKLTREMLLIMAVSAAVAVVCVLTMYAYRFGVYAWAMEHGLAEDGRQEYKEWFLEQAKHYELKPDSIEAGKDQYDKDNLPFLEENPNRYILVSIYRQDEGTYVTGHFPVISESVFWNSWLWSDLDIFLRTQAPMEFEAEFADCTADVELYSYCIMKIVTLYLLSGILLAVLIFLMPVLIFVHRRISYLGKVRGEVLLMAEGDLEHSITVRGTDEISSLAEELNELRLALKDSLEKERKSHEDNRELIRAMSHDLRTPLTTLYGYLEILNRMKGDPEKYPEYVRRCLKKTEEIRSMSDKMLEYTLVFEGGEKVERQKLSLDSLWTELEEQNEGLNAQGFQIECDFSDRQERTFWGNAFLLKRLLGNLYSNIRRYGMPEHPVKISVKVGERQAEISMENQVKEKPQAAGSGVGLKSASQIAALHGGKLTWENTDGSFRAVFCLPID